MDNTKFNTVCAVSQPAVIGMCPHQWLVHGVDSTPAQLLAPAGRGLIDQCDALRIRVCTAQGSTPASSIRVHIEQ